MMMDDDEMMMMNDGGFFFFGMLKFPFSSALTTFFSFPWETKLGWCEKWEINRQLFDLKMELVAGTA